MKGTREVSLYAVSLTVPKHARARIDVAGRTFAARMMREGARGVLLSKDVGPKTGTPHWYGLVLRTDGGAIGRAWIQESGAHSGCIGVTPVTAWEAFAVAGDLDASAGRRGTFRQNLSNVVHYAFKPWPEGCGSRDIAADVIAAGLLDPLWTEVLTTLGLSSLPSADVEVATPWARDRELAEARASQAVLRYA